MFFRLEVLCILCQMKCSLLIKIPNKVKIVYRLYLDALLESSLLCLYQCAKLGAEALICILGIFFRAEPRFLAKLQQHHVGNLKVELGIPQPTVCSGGSRRPA